MPPITITFTLTPALLLAALLYDLALITIAVLLVRRRRQGAERRRAPAPPQPGPLHPTTSQPCHP